MVVLNQNNILNEIVVGLRNADIFTTTQRSVTTATKTGTYSGASTDTIPVTNVKNIRSIVVGGTTLAFGSEYTVNYDHSTGSVITYIAAQTGAYTITYDYGTDKMFSGWPRLDLSISSFPRIAIDFIDIITVPFGIGNVNISQFDIRIIVYDSTKKDIRTYMNSVRSFIITNQSSFYYTALVTPKTLNFIGLGDFVKVKDEIYQQYLDIICKFNVED